MIRIIVLIIHFILLATVDFTKVKIALAVMYFKKCM